MSSTRIVLGTLTILFLIGCASSKTDPALAAREARLVESLKNVSALCGSALTTVDRLERAKEKIESKTAGDVVASMNNNYWALIPIPGAKLLGASKKDRDELGMYNRDGCWNLSCIDEKLEESRAAVLTHCGNGNGQLPVLQMILPAENAGS